MSTTMGIYDDRVLPYFTNLACGTKGVMRLRKQVVPLAEGEVLEVGMGSGLNLAYYDTSKVSRVWGLEPSFGMRRKARKNLEAADVEVKLLDLPGEEIPLDDNSVDTVLLTYTLCTIPDWQTALTQMRRVLKPGGKLLFCEHSRSPDLDVQKWQDRLNPGWKKLAGGCHINRPITELMEQTGFEIRERANHYERGVPRFLGYTTQGVANIA